MFGCESVSEGRGNRCDKNDTIKYDKIALKNGKTKMTEWAEREGELTIKNCDKTKNERIWEQIKGKMQKMITDNFPAKPKNEPRKKK